MSPPHSLSLSFSDCNIQTNRHTNMTVMHPSMLCEYPSTKSINTCHETQRIRERLRDRDKCQRDRERDRDKDREIERETGTKTEK